ncbi:hypothetical protein TEA_001426 [Camellia sinensis var. sinensis]|uniref:DUF7903 domain-containing protein n=1 Tax=Camellia sinensis var. sinensis TaxID=542762 RepID=A0A4S4DMR0_CAMSN|nr:hypothetical protein TEA_001426 [Camellia sinensis var. sinensis]
MSYIPPHKRHSKDEDKPPPTPESLTPQFHNNLNVRSSGSSPKDRKAKHSFKADKVKYADDAISRWFPVGFPSDLPISLKSFEQKLPLSLVLDTHLTKENKGDVLKSPWESIAEDVEEDLLSSFQNLRKVMECQEVNLKPTLVARSPSVSLENVKGTSVTETTLSQLKRSFYTNVPPTYMQYTTNEVVPKIGLDFEEEKELYQVKIELNNVRHLVLDISCLDRDLDLRLMLFTKRTVTALTDDEKRNIRSLINSAVLDQDVKGGLRWPLGKESSGDRYTVVGIWHTNAKTFTSSSMRLKVRHADRYDFRTSAGEVTGEVSLKMTGITSQLREQSSQIDMVTEMFKDNIKLIWDCFLCFCDVHLSLVSNNVVDMERADTSTINFTLLAIVEGGVRFPLHPLLRIVLCYWGLIPSQLNVNGHYFLRAKDVDHHFVTMLTSSGKRVDDAIVIVQGNWEFGNDLKRALTSADEAVLEQVKAVLNYKGQCKPSRKRTYKSLRDIGVKGSDAGEEIGEEVGENAQSEGRTEDKELNREIDLAFEHIDPNHCTDLPSISGRVDSSAPEDDIFIGLENLPRAESKAKVLGADLTGQKRPAETVIDLLEVPIEKRPRVDTTPIKDDLAEAFVIQPRMKNTAMLTSGAVEKRADLIEFSLKSAQEEISQLKANLEAEKKAKELAKVDAAKAFDAGQLKAKELYADEALKFEN